MVDPPREMRADPLAMQKWNDASEQERLRTLTSVADLVRDAIEAGEDPMAGVEYNDPEDEGVPRPTVHSGSVGPLGVASSTVVSRMRQVRDLLRSWGWTVREASGWETRGVRILTPSYIGCHHTGATVDIDGILINGRSDLNGPLCNFALHGDDTIVLIAAGTANHFGVATINNDQAYGIEATGPIPLSNTGRDAFPNYDAYIALVVAIRRVHGWGVDRVRGHKEVALPDGRKPDPAFEEGKPGDGYPAPYPEMSRFRSACNVTEVRKEEEDVPNTEQEIKTWVNDCLENKLGLKSGENLTLAVYGAVSNKDVLNRITATNNPASIASVLSGLVQSVADLTGLVASMKTDLSDDEAKIVANANARAAEITQLIQETHEDGGAVPPA